MSREDALAALLLLLLVELLLLLLLLLLGLEGAASSASSTRSSCASRTTQYSQAPPHVVLSTSSRSMRPVTAFMRDVADSPSRLTSRGLGQCVARR